MKRHNKCIVSVFWRITRVTRHAREIIFFTNTRDESSDFRFDNSKMTFPIAGNSQPCCMTKNQRTKRWRKIDNISRDPRLFQSVGFVIEKYICYVFPVYSFNKVFKMRYKNVLIAVFRILFKASLAVIAYTPPKHPAQLHNRIYYTYVQHVFAFVGRYPGVYRMEFVEHVADYLTEYQM